MRIPRGAMVPACHTIGAIADAGRVLALPFRAYDALAGATIAAAGMLLACAAIVIARLAVVGPLRVLVFAVFTRTALHGTGGRREATCGAI